MEFVILFELPGPLQFIFAELAGMCLDSISQSVTNTHSVQVPISRAPYTPYTPPPPTAKYCRVVYFGAGGGGGGAKAPGKKNFMSQKFFLFS